MTPPTIAEAFPADDLLARWVMVLCIARNDLALGTERIVRANQADDGTALHWHRLLAGQFYEAGDFLRRTKDIPDVQAFVAQLPADKQADYGAVLQTAKRWNPKRLRRGRNRTFHYVDIAPRKRRLLDRVRRRRRPSPGPEDIKRALTALADEPAEIRAPGRTTSGELTPDRFLFADKVAAYFSVEDLSGDTNQLMASLTRIADEVTKLVRFANAAVSRYQAVRGVQFPTV